MHCIALLFSKLQSLTTHCNFFNSYQIYLKHYGKRNN